MKSDISLETLKAIPAAAGATAAAVTLNQWIAIGTGVYIVVQVAYLLRKWWREEKDWARRKGRR